VSCECPTFELPCEAAAGESFAQGGDHPSPPSLTPHFPQSPIQRHQGSSPAPAVVSSRGRSRPLPPLRGPQGKYGGMRGREVPPRRPSVPCDRHLSPSASVVCEHPAALRSIRCWVVPGRDSSSSAGSVRRVPSLHSSGKPSACLYLAAIPPGLVSFPPCARSSLRCGPCSSPKPQSLPGSQEAGVPPAGADSVGIPLRSTRHRLRRSDSARLRLERSASIRAVSRSGSGR
jgi:hypothetical protein